MRVAGGRAFYCAQNLPAFGLTSATVAVHRAGGDQRPQPTLAAIPSRHQAECSHWRAARNRCRVQRRHARTRPASPALRCRSKALNAAGRKRAGSAGPTPRVNQYEAAMAQTSGTICWLRCLMRTVNLGLSQTGVNLARLDCGWPAEMKIIADPLRYGFDNVTRSGPARPVRVVAGVFFFHTGLLNVSMRSFVLPMITTPPPQAQQMISRIYARTLDTALQYAALLLPWQRQNPPAPALYNTAGATPPPGAASPGKPWAMASALPTAATSAVCRQGRVAWAGRRRSANTPDTVGVIRQRAETRFGPGAALSGKARWTAAPPVISAA